MSKEKSLSKDEGLRNKLSSKVKAAWYKAGAFFTCLTGGAVANASIPATAHAVEVPDVARKFITGGCDAIFLVVIVIGAGVIALGLIKIGNGMRDGQSPTQTDGFNQIGGGILVCMAAGLFKSIPSILGI